MSELIIIAGATAVGKTAVSIEIAKMLNCDIISCDSRQMYKEMSIGTAVPSPEELSAVRHHFIQQISVHDYYNVSRYETEVLELLEHLFKMQKRVVMTGGSGLYIDAVCKGIDPMPDPSPEIRQGLNHRLQEEGLEPLLRELEKNDPDYYQVVDKNNPARIIRALEIYEQTGTAYSKFRKEKPTKRPFKITKIALNTDREYLYERINQRVDIMLEAGLLEEVKSLYPLKDLTPLKTVGYRELFDAFDNRFSLEEAVERIKNNTRKYARKQISWLRRDKDYQWFDPKNIDAIKAYLNGGEL